MTKLALNSRMPYMLFNWAQHDTRTARLTLAERGMFDVARSALWQVEGCRMPLEVLKVRLRVAPESQEANLLDTLVALDLLTVDGGMVYDDVQVREFEAAVQKAEVNRENGKKGGRPRKPSDPPPQPPSPSGGQAAPDF
jgi:hypothetical protein